MIINQMKCLLRISSRNQLNSLKIFTQSFKSLQRQQFIYQQSLRKFSSLQDSDQEFSIEERKHEKLKEDSQEMPNIYRHLSLTRITQQEIKDSIEELIDDEDDSRALMAVIGNILSTIQSEKDLKKYQKSSDSKDIDRILRSQLKSDFIDHKDFGAIHMYLNTVGGSEATIEYAVKVIHDNIRRCTLADIGLAMYNAAKLDNKDKTDKFFEKVESFLLLTHDNFIKGRNLKGVLMIIDAMGALNFGTTQLWKRLNELLESQLKLKRQILEKEQIIMTLIYFARKHIGTEMVWKSLIDDLALHFESKTINLEDAYLFLKALYLQDLAGEENYDQLINYIVDRGYDADDFEEILGLKRGVNLVYRLSRMHPKLSNNNFIVHVQEFIERNLDNFGKGQLVKVLDTVDKIQKLRENEDLKNKVNDKILYHKITISTNPEDIYVKDLQTIDSENEYEEDEFEVDDDPEKANKWKV